MGVFKYATLIILILSGCSEVFSCPPRPQPNPPPKQQNQSRNSHIGKPKPELRNASFAHIFYGMKREGDPLINLISYYDNCGLKKGCIPKDCLVRQNCDYLVTWYFVQGAEYINFQVILRSVVDGSGTPCSKYTEESRPYIALAFTKEETKSKANVIECSIRINTNTSERGAVMAWNADGKYKRWDYVCAEGARTGKIMHCQVDLDMNSQMVCEFRLKRRVVINQEIFNFAADRFFMHIVSGCNVTDLDNGIQKGAVTFSTERRVNLDLYKERFP